MKVTQLLCVWVAVCLFPQRLIWGREVPPRSSIRGGYSRMKREDIESGHAWCDGIESKELLQPAVSSAAMRGKSA